MNTTLTIHTERRLRDDVKKTAREIGIPLTVVMNAMMRQFVRDRRLATEAECPFPSHTPNAETRKAMRETVTTKNAKVFRSFAEFEKHIRAL